MTETDGPVTWRQLLAETTAALGDRQHARWMCAVAAGCSSVELVHELDAPATTRMVASLDRMINDRRGGEPLQYVLGSWQFRTLDLMIDRRVLIPRPETEWVCQVALDLARHVVSRPRRMVDLGTGSGAIGMTLAAELPVGSTEVWLTDVSPDALDVARANLAGLGRAGASIRIAEGSWYGALPDALRGSVDVVVANPPYIAEGDTDLDRSVLDWEPHVALFGGLDGLEHVRTIVRGAAEWLTPSGWLVVEIGSSQGRDVRALLAEAGFRHVEIRNDLAHRDRIALGQRPPSR